MRQFLAVIGILLVVVSCTLEENKTTQTNSSHFTNPQEKLAFLKQYVTAHSRILDAEYDIRYHDNSTGLLAAPSDWYITTAIRVDKDSLDQWLSATQHEAYQIRLDLWKTLSMPAQTWPLTGPQEVYAEGQAVKVVYRSQGILLAAYTSNGMFDLEKYRIRNENH